MARHKGPKKPLPADFAEHAAAEARPALKARYGVCQDVITRWFKEIGGNPRSALKHKLLSLPADFTTIAPTMTITALQAHYGVSERPVKRWIAETGVTTSRIGNRKPQKHKRELPADFREVASTMTYRALCTHYRISREVLSRWMRESGARSLYADAPKAEVARACRLPRQSRGFNFGGHSQIRKHTDLRLMTMFDEAADVLRRERFVVYRCDDRGRANQKGEFWRLGNTLLTPDELLIRAAKYRKVAA